jgi:ABC-2 type transport system ATP-binding protein
VKDTGTISEGPSEYPLVARQLTKRYRRRRTAALDHVSIDVRAATVTALVGPNGSGKSTLIKLWAGLEMPSSGMALVRGRQPGRGGRGVLGNLAYIPQAPALYRELTVGDHFDLAAHLRPGFDRHVARAHVKRLSIDVDRSCGELSGGEAAQVSLAIALATHAPILLLDEPLANLDPLARSEFLTVLREAIAMRGSTALLSSHVVRDVEQGCDWLVVLGVGRVMFDDSVAAALAGHAVLPVALPTTNEEELVAVLPDGRQLLRSTGTLLADARAPSLEDVVLGYLARSRQLS